jgi:hypothetical protein
MRLAVHRYFRSRVYAKKSSRAASQARWSHNSPASSPVGTAVMTGPKHPRRPWIAIVGMPKAPTHSIPCGGHAACLALLLPPWPLDMIGGLHGEYEPQRLWYETISIIAGLGVHRDLEALVSPFLGQRHGQ